MENDMRKQIDKVKNFGKSLNENVDLRRQKVNDLTNLVDMIQNLQSELKYPKGVSSLKWLATDKSGKALPSGAYFIKNKGGGYNNVLKVMYLK